MPHEPIRRGRARHGAVAFLASSPLAESDDDTQGVGLLGCNDATTPTHWAPTGARDVAARESSSADPFATRREWEAVKSLPLLAFSDLALAAGRGGSEPVKGTPIS